MSQVAILLILAAGQIDDSGWQSNNDRRSVFSSGDTEQNANGRTVENASFQDKDGGFDNRESSTGFDESVDQDFSDDVASPANDWTPDLDIDENSNPAIGDGRPVESFWDRHDLLLNAPLPARDLDAQTPTSRFRRVDSWNVPMPELKVEMDQIGQDDQFPWKGQMDERDRRRNQNRRREDNRRRDETRDLGRSGINRDFYPASDRDRYVPDQILHGASDLRRPDNNARELNGQRSDASEDNELLPVRLDPPPLNSSAWMPAGKAINLMFGGKKNSQQGEQATSDSSRQNSFFTSTQNMFWPFVFATLGLIASIAFNFYLGFTAWDIHAQYQDVVADLTDLETREDEMPPSLLENRTSTGYSSRVDQPVSRRRSISI